MTTKETVVETKTKSVDESVLALSAKIEEGVKLDKKLGTGEQTSELFDENLPEGLTTEHVKSLTNYSTTFVAAGTHAFGKLAVEAMKGNKTLKEANISIRMAGKDTLDINVLRSKEYSNPLVKDSEPVTKYGVVTAKYEVHAGANRAQLKVVRNTIAELAMAHLSK